MAPTLAVSELLQVTEEARVFVALGHPERAIDVLNEHIKHVPRSMPAAWLMLLDLYHATGNRQEFPGWRRFHHCNVQAPLWEGFRAAEANDRTQTYPRTRGGRHVAPPNAAIPGALLYENREGRRIGFPGAYGDILLLLQILDAPAVDIDSDLAAPEIDRPAAAPGPTPPRSGGAARPDENLSGREEAADFVGRRRN
jgi:hypothetical protein